jgi:hypothetical protein
MKTTNFELGTPVNVITPSGIIAGKIVWHYRNTTKNQFAVSFPFENATYTYCFSKKTGRIYGGEKLVSYHQFRIE